MPGKSACSDGSLGIAWRNSIARAVDADLLVLGEVCGAELAEASVPVVCGIDDCAAADVAALIAGGAESGAGLDCTPGMGLIDMIVVGIVGAAIGCINKSGGNCVKTN